MSRRRSYSWQRNSAPPTASALHQQPQPVSVPLPLGFNFNNSISLLASSASSASWQVRYLHFSFGSNRPIVRFSGRNVAEATRSILSVTAAIASGCFKQIAPRSFVFNNNPAIPIFGRAITNEFCPCLCLHPLQLLRRHSLSLQSGNFLT